MRPADLGDRVVTEPDEDPPVEVGGALAFGAVERAAGLGHVRGELVQVQAAERASPARVTRKQCAFHRLRQVRQGEDGAVEVREMRREQRTRPVCESLDGIAHVVAILERRAAGETGSPAAPMYLDSVAGESGGCKSACLRAPPPLLVTAPVFIIAVVIVRYLRDPLERRRPDEGKARDLEERLGRLVDGERGQQARQ